MCDDYFDFIMSDKLIYTYSDDKKYEEMRLNWNKVNELNKRYFVFISKMFQVLLDNLI